MLATLRRTLGHTRATLSYRKVKCSIFVESAMMEHWQRKTTKGTARGRGDEQE